MLNQIVDQVRKMDSLVAEIANASGEQSEGLVQITKAMTEMDRVTQSNAATAEESASVANELSSQSTELGAAVHQLNVFTGSSAQPGAMRAATRPPHAGAPANPPAVRRPARPQTIQAAEIAATSGKVPDEKFWS